MAINLGLNSLTISGQTKLNLNNNSGEAKIPVSDINGFVDYTTVTLSTGDEIFTNQIIYTSDPDTPTPKNSNYIVKADDVTSPNPTIFYFENTLQTTLIGDKIRINNLTFGGADIAIAGKLLNASTMQTSNSSRWVVYGGSTEISHPGFSPNEDVYTGYNVTFIGADDYYSEYTLLYSPLGMCKNGSRLTITLGTFPNIYTYTSTDYIWYRTKVSRRRMNNFLSTGTPPVGGGGSSGGGGSFGGGGGLDPNTGGGSFGGGGDGF